MSEQKWTPEPWKWNWRRGDTEAPGSVFAEPIEGHAYAVAMCPKYRGKGAHNEWSGDAQRIVTCVNACQGAPETIQAGAVKAMAEALERILNAGEWYGSALEIDQYVTDAVDGETLEAMGRAALRLYHGDE